MYLLNVETEIQWTINPTENPPALSELDLAIMDPLGSVTYLTSPIFAENYVAPTSLTAGLVKHFFTPPMEGSWKIRLVIGVASAYKILDKVEMQVSDNTQLVSTVKYQINTVPDEKSLTQPGILLPITGAIRWYPTRKITVREIQPNLGVPTQGRAAIIDVLKNGSSMLGAPFVLQPLQHKGSPKMPIHPIVTPDEYITVDVLQRGDLVYGSDLFVNFKYD